MVPGVGAVSREVVFLAPGVGLFQGKWCLGARRGAVFKKSGVLAPGERSSSRKRRPVARIEAIFQEMGSPERVGSRQ